MKEQHSPDTPPELPEETTGQQEEELHKMDEEAMRIAIFLGMILGSLLGVFLRNLELGFPVGIAICVIVELLLKHHRHRGRGK